MELKRSGGSSYSFCGRFIVKGSKEGFGDTVNFFSFVSCGDRNVDGLGNDPTARRSCMNRRKEEAILLTWNPGEEGS